MWIFPCLLNTPLGVCVRCVGANRTGGRFLPIQLAARRVPARFGPEKVS